MKPTLTTRIILFSFHCIPLRLRKVLFKGVSRLFYHLSSRQRLIALQNLKYAFPEKTVDERIRIAKGVFDNLAIVMAEFFEIPWITKENVHQWVEFEGLDHIKQSLAKGKGILSIVAHFGNWEMITMAFPLVAGWPIQIVYRPLDNAILDNLFGYVRTVHGNALLPKGVSGTTITRLLSENKAIGILSDQNMDTREGVFVDFFGRPACTAVGIAILARRTGAPIHPGFMLRKNDGMYKFIIGPEVELTRTNDYEADLRENTQRFTKVIEEYVRRYPEQWFWIHQRWKTKPWQ
jgi:Kdo2-lipid IVA lauroyltransferase/acyltransferase